MAMAQPLGIQPARMMVALPMPMQMQAQRQAQTQMQVQIAWVRRQDRAVVMRCQREGMAPVASRYWWTGNTRQAATSFLAEAGPAQSLQSAASRLLPPELLLWSSQLAVLIEGIVDIIDQRASENV